MNVYFFTTNPSLSYKNNLAIISSLQKVGGRIYSNLEGLAPVFDWANSIDALVSLGVGESRDLAYVIALGIARRKPVLYLLPKGLKIPEEILKINESRDIKKVLMISFFTHKRLDLIIRNFLEKKFLADDICNIKYTLRLNRGLNRYLHWKSKRAKKTKANLIRVILESSMESDERYREKGK
ncbi:MAG: hypothetical protein A2240_00040 [Candidatus Jacksonbacteria bacterium RIFOXYA2_FULL_43_12]|nr:MAG: hypothetical protein A2240_00040 [Candidatus Jacksonbacteria bacterium RIFOXYA2_FULL_43_12]